jgi:hypothetical protein
MEGFQAAGLLPSDGVVEPEDYETIQRTNDTLKARFLLLAENKEERAWMDKVWRTKTRRKIPDATEVIQSASVTRLDWAEWTMRTLARIKSV